MFVKKFALFELVTIAIVVLVIFWLVSSAQEISSQGTSDFSFSQVGSYDCNDWNCLFRLVDPEHHIICYVTQSARATSTAISCVNQIQ